LTQLGDAVAAPWVTAVPESLFLDLRRRLGSVLGEGAFADVAQACLETLRQRTGFHAGAVYWVYAEGAAVAAAEPAGAAADFGGGAHPLQDLPLLPDMLVNPGDVVRANIAAVANWRRCPLLAGVDSVLLLPVAGLARWSAVVVLGWTAPGVCSDLEMGLAVEAATWLGAWLTARATAVRRRTRQALASAPAVEAPANADGRHGASEVLQRVLAAAGYGRGLLLGAGMDAPYQMAASGMTWEDASHTKVISQAVSTLLQAGEGAAPIFRLLKKGIGGFITVAPLAYRRQSPHAVLVLGKAGGAGPTFEDFVVAEEVARATAHEVAALQQEDQLDQERALRQRIEALTLELGRKLSFAELFEVLSRRLPTLVAASWIGLYRLPLPNYAGHDPAPRLHQKWLVPETAAQPPLLPQVDSLLGTVAPGVSLSYIPDPPPSAKGALPVAVIPVRMGQQIVAALMVAAATKSGFSSVQLTTLRELSASIALAIRYVQVFEQEERARRDWEHSFDAITDTLSVITPSRRIRRVNRTFAVEQGLQPPDLMGKSCHQALYGLSEPCANCPLDSVVRRRAAADTEVRSQLNNSLFQASLFPILNESGAVEAVVEFAKDVTLARELQQKLLQTERLRALGEMASGAAHDFNNTLAGVLGQVELLLDSAGSDPAMQKGLRIIAQAASDGAATVRRIQNFARTTRGEEVSAVDLNQIVLDAIEVCAPRWKNQSERDGIAIQVTPHLDAVSPAAGVPSELREALVNLIFNAIEAMPNGGAINVRTRETPDWVSVAVSDDGVGMSEEVRQHIFDPFYSTKGTANSGLGMSVVYGIVKLHRGEILVDSVEGQGSIMTIRLPKAVNAPASEPPAEPQNPRQAGWRVLVVDDDPRLGDLLKRMLEIDSHVVTMCTSGSAAIAHLESAPFDLVFTDLGMPEVSGWDVVAAARKLQPGICTGLVTGWGVQLEEWEISGRGVDVVVPKPYTLAALRSTITALDEVRQQRLAPKA
jgi:signal transduction histidine kinase/CheY-like chemotaxis protein